MTHQPIRPGLILSRRAGEVIVIELPAELGGHQIEIACLEIARHQTRLSLNCPRTWNVFRGELRGLAVAPKQKTKPRPE